MYSCHRVKNGSADNSIGSIRRVDLIWSFRDVQLLDSFADMIEQWSSLSTKAKDDESNSVEVCLHLYCSSIDSTKEAVYIDVESSKSSGPSVLKYEIASSSSGKPHCIEIQAGRPCIDKLFEAIMNKTCVTASSSKSYFGLEQYFHSTSQGLLVSTLVCGVTQLIDAVSEASYKYGANFQAEEFNF